jgi:Ca-activated chloride channel family protein
MLVFAYPYTFFITIPLFIFILWYRANFFKPASYTYPLARLLHKKTSFLPAHYILYALRLVSLLTLIFLIAKPQTVDVTSKVQVEGVDIILALDVSGSMQCIDDPQQARTGGSVPTRLELAKQEALRFVDKRGSDPIGLVLFGREAVSRVPLTLDKKILKEVLGDIHLGIINDEGTVLSKSIIVAASRLKNAKAKSKVIILLTDGQPSPEDSSYEAAVEIARKLGIKIYTIGIGGDVGYFNHPQVGLIPVGSSLNKELLQFLADQTGGRFFEARKQNELRAIYDQIDRLEKTDYEETIFSNYYDIFVPFVWFILGLMFFEILLSSFVWFTV